MDIPPEDRHGRGHRLSLATDEVPKKVSTFARVSAWIFVAFFALAVLAVSGSLISGGKLSSLVPSESPSTILNWVQLALSLLGGAIIVPLCFSIAFRGRPPRWWRHFENAMDLNKQLGRFNDSRNRP